MNTYDRLMILVAVLPLLLIVTNKILIAVSGSAAPQRLAIRSVLLSSAIVVTGLLTLPEFNFAIGLYLVGVSLSIGYVYFHFFNMSETARRIKILTGIYTQTFVTRADVESYYGDMATLETRLRRLQELNQIDSVDGKYVLRKRLLFAVARLMVVLRKLLRIETNAT